MTSIAWGDDADWGQFVAYNVSWATTNVLTLGVDAGEGIASGVLSGLGSAEERHNDRRWFLLAGTASDSEIVSLWDPARVADAPGQVGHVHRAVDAGLAGQSAVVVWQNVVAGGWGGVIVAVWQGTDADAQYGTAAGPQTAKNFASVLGGGDVPAGPYWVRSKLIGSQVSVKVWSQGDAEPPDGTSSHELVVTYDAGAVPGGSGQSGLLIAHLGDTSEVGIGPLTATSLDPVPITPTPEPAVSVGGDTGYRFVVEDIVSGRLIGELPLTSVRWSLALGAAGSLSGQLDEVTAGRLRDLLDPGRRALYAVRGSAIVWGGIIWAAPLGEDGTVQVSAEGWHGYWAHRDIRVPRLWSSVGLFTLYRTLIADAQDPSWQGWGADLGISVVWDQPSGLSIGPIGYDSNARPNLGEKLANLANATNGFDPWWEFGIDDSGKITKQVRLYYPYKGRDQGQQFYYEADPDRPPGNVLSRSIDYDASALAWRWSGFGNGEGDAKLTSFVEDGDLRGVYPPLDGETTYSDATSQTAVDWLTAADLYHRERPVLLPTLTLDPTMPPAFGTWEIGDIVTYVDTGQYQPYDDKVRITGVDVTVTDEGDETVKVTVQRPEDAGVRS